MFWAREFQLWKGYHSQVRKNSLIKDGVLAYYMDITYLGRAQVFFIFFPKVAPLQTATELQRYPATTLLVVGQRFLETFAAFLDSQIISSFMGTHACVLLSGLHNPIDSGDCKHVMDETDYICQLHRCTILVTQIVELVCILNVQKQCAWNMPHLLFKIICHLPLIWAALQHAITIIRKNLQAG